MVFNFSILALGKQRQIHLCELEANLIYIESSRPPKATQKNPGERRRRRVKGGGGKGDWRELGLESVKWNTLSTTLPCPSPWKQTIIQDLKIYYSTIVVK